MEGRLKPLSSIPRPAARSMPLTRSTHRLNGELQQRVLPSDDMRYMRRALALARRAEGRTSPNPLVGAVIVRGGRIIGEGFHRRAGAPHAEVVALQRAGASAHGGTLYVTLEPCHHLGRTPPCTDAVLAARIARVVVAARDPNPITDGRGIARLRRAGIRVVTGLLEAEAERLNEPFRKAMTSQMPLVLAKSGQSLDGKIATAGGESRWITSPAARRLVHHWRSRVDAVLVGVQTVLRDDPLLTVRGVARRPGRPIKVIVDSRLRTPPTARCLSAASPAPSIVATTCLPRRGAGMAMRSRAQHRALTRSGAEVVAFPARRGRVPLRRLCRYLVRRGIQSVLIEGGGELLAGALEERVVDRILFFIAPVLLGGRSAPSSVGGAGVSRLTRAVRLAELTCRRVGPDLCIEARVVYPRGLAKGPGAGGGKAVRKRAPRPTPHSPPAVR